MPFKHFLDMHGIQYNIERVGRGLLTAKGLINHEKATGKPYIGFEPNVNIATGDIVINSSGERFYIIDIRTSYFQTRPEQIKAFYKTDEEDNFIRETTINVANAYGSVIGVGNNAKIDYRAEIPNLRELVNSAKSQDSEELQKIVDLLEMIVNDNVPVQKGLFSKFADVMERNSWITSSVASTILNWLTSSLL